MKQVFLTESLIGGWRLVIAGCALSLAWAGPVAFSSASAQTVSDGEIEEILVTARRRSEEISRVPAVISAFSGAQLEERTITNQTDLQFAVPGLTVRQTESSNLLNYVIRGQTVDPFSSTPTAVVPYINEVQFSPGGMSSFFDLESLQVVKGPQGTLFGRNATGGAVLLSTAKPTDRTEGNLQVSIGNYNYVNLQGMLNLPVTEKVLIRGAFDMVRRNGYQFNKFDGSHPGATRRSVGRVSVTLRPTDRIENTTVVQAESAGGNNSAPVLYSFNRCGAVAPDGRALNCNTHLFFGPQLDQNLAGVFGAPFPGAWALYLSQHPRANPGGIQAALLAQQNGDFWDTNESAPLAHRGRNWFVTNTTTFDINDNLTFKNIFGASRAHSSDLAGEVGAPFGILYTSNLFMGPARLITNSNDEVRKVISDEAQFSGTTADGALNYVAGFYFQQNRDQIFYPATYLDVRPIIPLAPAFGNVDNTHYKTQGTTKAVYAHGSYDLSTVIDGLTFNAGVRYTWDDVKSDTLSLSRFFPGPTLETSFDKPSWNVGLDYQISENLMVYVQQRGSWRTGGINSIGQPVLTTSDVGGSLFLPETASDVEVGVKYHGDVGGRSAHLYLAAYQMWIENIQRAQTILVGGAPRLVTVNVPEARVRGVEFDTAVEVADRVELGMVGAYTDAKYTKNRLVIFGTRYAFGPYADTPKWSGTIYAQLTMPLSASMGEVRFRADIYGQSGMDLSNTANTRTPGTHIPGYSTTNLRLDWANMMGREGLQLSVFARNVLGEEYYTGGFALGDLLGVNSANVGEPLTWGATLKYSF